MFDLGTLLISTGAAARLTRLATTDTVTHTPRTALLTRLAQPRHIRTQINHGHDAPPPTPARATLVELATCHWCLGFWVTAATLAAAYLVGDTLTYQLGAAILAASYAVGWLADNEAE